MFFSNRLNIYRCDRLWNLTNYSVSGNVENGITVRISKPKYIPTSEEMLQGVIFNLQHYGFSVDRVAPSKANAVIRTFWSKKYLYEDSAYWTYGVQAYLKTPDSFWEKFYSELNAPIKYNKFYINVQFCQDDLCIVEPNFTDYFVKITKKD